VTAAPREEEPWLRLDPRMILVSLVMIVLSLLPLSVAVWGFGVRLSPLAAAPAVVATSLGLLGALRDALTWIKTRYRVTDECVERRTGLLVRHYRRIPRDRIRSVDVTAKLQHRVAGLRVVTIGAGQQATSGDALKLDALSRNVTERLRRELLGGGTTDADQATADETVIATIRWSWLFYNVVNGWAFVVAAGMFWVAYWAAETFGINLLTLVGERFDWRSMGAAPALAIAVGVVFVFGVAMLALLFVTEYWGFRLSRVPGPHGTLLRTTKGLTNTRQVDRDDRRLRGAQISEPVLWRWAGMADTEVIATGLKMLSADSAAAILPRGPISVARRVVATVLGLDPSPLTAPLQRHPGGALRRRIWWALLFTAACAGGLWWLSATVSWLPGWWPLIVAGVLLAAMAAAVVAYRALGHGLVDGYLVVRAGLTNRTTAALQTRSVVGWTFRQSLFQRRLGLVTLTATTAAGSGAYLARDLDAAAAVTLADRAVPGLLAPFIARPDGGDEPVSPPAARPPAAAPAPPPPLVEPRTTPAPAPAGSTPDVRTEESAAALGEDPDPVGVLALGLPGTAQEAGPQLLAVSDLHVGRPGNRRIVEEMRPTTEDDWLVIAGDVGELFSEVDWALGTLRARFNRVLWTPGNHELWTHPHDPVGLRGEERYEALVQMCRSLDVATPEDPYPVFDGVGGPVTVAPLFLLYDYTFLPPDTSTKAQALVRAYRSAAVCADEFLLHSDPYPSLEAWCEQRLASTVERLSSRAAPHLPTVLVNHFPLARQATDGLPDPLDALWYGTTRTADWHVRFNASHVVHGELYLPRLLSNSAARDPEQAIGRPADAHRPPSPLRKVLTAAPESSQTAAYLPSQLDTFT